MIESKFVRCQPEDASRCQAVGKGGQCPYRAIGTRFAEGSDWDGPAYCPRHGPKSDNKDAEERNRRLYLSALWKDKIGEQADHPRVKSLREEVGILRMTLEQALSSCKDPTQLLMRAGQIIEFAREIGKLLKTAHAIEKDMCQLLDRTQAEQWVQELLTVISDYVADPEILSQISEDMLASLEARCQVPELR